MRRKGFAWKRAALLAMTLVLLVILGSMVEWREVGRVVARADGRWLLSGCLITLLFPLLNTLRWMAVLKAAGVRMGFWRAFSVTMACWPVGTLTPAKAGELLKAAAVQPEAELSTGVGTVLAERIVDVGVLGAVGAVFGAVCLHPVAALTGLGGMTAAMMVFAMAMWMERRLRRGRDPRRVLPGAGLLPAKWREKVSGKLLALTRVFSRLRRNRPAFAACAGFSAINWFLSMLQLWILLEAFRAPAPLALMMAILPAATFAGLLPLTIAGAGTRDAALLFLAAGAVDPAALFAAGVVYTLTGYFGLGVLGLPFLHRWARSKPRPAA